MKMLGLPSHLEKRWFEANSTLLRQRDRAERRSQYLLGACVALLLGLLYVALQIPPKAPECPSPGVMQLDPTTIRVPALEAQWL